MPYNNIGDLPDAVKSRYSARCQKVFLDAFNRAVKDGNFGAASEEKAFKIAHTAAGMCKDAGKAVSKAEALDVDEMQAWFEGKIPRRLLAIPFGGPIPSYDGKGRDLDLEFFDENTDIKPEWFEERPVDWHHSQDPTGKLNGVLIGKAKNLTQEEDGWWVDLWLNAGEKRLSLIKRLTEKGAELFGSSYAYPNLVKRGKAGHIDVWPYMMQTLSTSPQNTNSIHRPAKAVLDAFTEADISVDSALKAMLTELDVLRDLPETFPIEGSDQAAKAEAELLEFLDSANQQIVLLRDQIRT